MNTNELAALINLLDDPDDTIFTHVEEKIVTLGAPAIPVLESTWETNMNSVLQSRIENIIHKIQFEGVEKNLTQWIDNGAQSLLDGLLIIAKYQYPDVDEETIHEQINSIKRDVWVELRDDLTALEKVKILNHIFFNIHGFAGNTSNFHSPNNSFVNAVLESHKGNPLMLCAIYSIVAQSLNIPLMGINLPELFILGYVDEHATGTSSVFEHGSNILFYVNVFAKGTVFGHKEIDKFLLQIKLQPNATHYEPCHNVDIIKRVLRNLIFAFEKNSDLKRVNEIKYILARIAE
jgi:hypothetical protein